MKEIKKIKGKQARANNKIHLANRRRAGYPMRQHRSSFLRANINSEPKSKATSASNCGSHKVFFTHCQANATSEQSVQIINYIQPIITALIMFLLLSTTLASSFAAAQSFNTQPTTSFTRTSSATYVTRQQTASFHTYYGNNVNTYWPILGDKYTCEARQDLMLQVPPVGCQPAVVRSDLLAEQNVPVFCQIDAIKLNPLLDISQVTNIRFSGQYPPEVQDVGFHPARAALRTTNNLLGSPSPNNIGYAVIILKRQPVESKLPESVTIPLSAQVQYLAGNAYGIGKAEFILEKVPESKWESEKLKQSFWNGRYFIKLEEADSNFAQVSIYEGDRKLTTQRVALSQTSQVIYVPGMYCRAGVQIAYDGFVAARNKARIEVSSGDGADVFDVYEGSRFMDDRCSINRIDYLNSTGVGRVTGNCKGQEFVLELRTIKTNKSIEQITFQGNQYSVTQTGSEYDVTINSEIYKLDLTDQLTKWLDNKLIILINSTGSFNETNVNQSDKVWLPELRASLLNYKNSRTGSAITSRQYSQETLKYFDDAIASYEKVASDYPNEKEGTLGKEALKRGIELAADFGKDNVKIRLINKYAETYPGDADTDAYLSELKRMYEIDTSLAGESIQFDDKSRTIRLLDISEPIQKANADLNIENERVNLALGATKDLVYGGINHGRIIMDNINPQNVEISAYCTENVSGSTRLSSNRQRYSLNINQERIPICGIMVKLARAESQSLAKIRLIPQSAGTQTASNFTVNIGIEKRAIKLNPDKTLERIQKINETIKKWEDISKSLGTVVTGLKAACFATTALLTFKNFISGMSGESLARQEVMNGDNGWRNWCKERSGGDKEYISMDACYLANSDKIDADVSKTTSAINSVNQKIDAIQSKHKTNSGIFGESVNTELVRKDLANEIKSQYAGEKIKVGDNEIPIENILTDSNVNNGLVTTDEMRSLMLNLELRKTGGLNSEVNSNPDKKLVDIAQRVKQNSRTYKEFEDAKALKAVGYPTMRSVTGTGQTDMAMDVVPLTPKLRQETGITDEKITHLAMVSANPGRTPATNGANVEKFAPGVYFLGLAGDSVTGTYNVQTVVKKEDKSIVEPSGFATAYGIGNIKSADRLSYVNQIDPTSRKCSFYETEPYRGMPAVVPFDYRNGWYAATKQTLPVFGGIGAFDASGRVTSFWLCNVGKNGRVEFETGFGDDLCEQINLNTGQPLGSFPGLSETEAKEKVNQAVRAIQDAANQFGNKYITVAGERCEVGPPSTGQAQTQCQDFMSPTDCHIMFNVCDPVICPPSRCNLGGQYYVSDVVQSGIIGSVLLCLPNIREKIIIPVCLTGIKAGIDALVSIMKSHRDCLQESLKSGQMVGICDEIYSIYLCEFFWNQLAPLINIIIPKIFEMSYGQGVRGGAEYLTVNSAWQNMQKSVNYFTNSYAVNSMKAFQVRSTEEVGGEFCKAFIGAKAPTAFKALIEPDSPPQFYAWFDAKAYTSATVPATSQYKVFYHIFAGNDQGVYFNVYLKSPPESSYYTTNPYVPVASNFIPRGQYASETKDFTAPEGYKELCVRINNDEHCGFKQVSTNFAINYLRDQYIKDEATNKQITSEEQCVGGTPSPASLLTPNIQQGVEETISPEVYNRGLIRICATQNPGLSTDPSRFADVGYCNDAKVRCWIDKQSVSKAITAGNVGTLNETLQVLESQTTAYLEQSGQIFTQSDSEARIQAFQASLDAIRKMTGDKRNQSAQLLNEIDSVFTQLFYNTYKAQALLIKAQVNDVVARDLLEQDDKRTRDARPKQTIPAAPATTQPSGQTALWTLESAIIATNSKTGSYSQNKDFVDGLWKDRILLNDEYEDINGGSYIDWNVEGDMPQLAKLLTGKKEAQQAAEGGFNLIIGNTESYGSIFREVISNKGKKSGIYLSLSSQDSKTGSVMVNIRKDFPSQAGAYNKDATIIINKLNDFKMPGRDGNLKEISGADYAILKNMSETQYSYTQLKEQTNNLPNFPEPPKTNEFYNLSVQGPSRYNLLFNNQPTGIYFEQSGLIYAIKVESSPAPILVGTTANNKINIAKLAGSEKIKSHLSFINGTTFTELRDKGLVKLPSD